MRCTNCGHQGAPGSTFCLNCGSRLEQSPDPGGTHQGAAGLPVTSTPMSGIGSAPTAPVMHGQGCTKCGASNAPSMRFCRQCGTPLGDGANPLTTAVGPASGPYPARPAAPAPTPAPIHVPPARSRPATPTPPPGMVPRGSSQPNRAATGSEGRSVQQCGACGGQTPGGFSFCQRCGKPLATAPAAQMPVAQAPVSTPFPTAPSQPHSQPHSQPQAVVQSRTPTPKSVRIPVATEPPWAVLISVNRDGSDGATHALSGDYVELGNSSAAGLRFDDPYLATCHARIERLGTGGARIIPLDTLNGVFRRLRQDTPLADGAVILIGRELLRYNSLPASESKPAQLAQHGVSLFGSPMRESWGRVSQLLPSGSIRDVRHLYGTEMVVGREEGDLVFADDEFLSRRHASFRRQNEQVLLSDLGSSNGTFLRLTEPANLSEGDFLRIGDQMFRYKPH